MSNLKCVACDKQCRDAHHWGDHQSRCIQYRYDTYIQELKSKHNTIVSELNSHIERYKKHIVGKNQEIQTLTSSVQRQIDDAVANCIDMYQSKYTEHLEEYKQQVEQHLVQFKSNQQSKIQSALVENEHLKTRVKELVKITTQQEERYKQALKDVLEYQVQVAKLQKDVEFEKSQREIQIHQEQINARKLIREKDVNFQKEKTALETEYDARFRQLQTESDTREKQLQSSFEKSFTGMKNELEAKLYTQKETHNKKIKELEQEQTTLIKKHQLSLQNLQTTNVNLTLEVDVLQKKITELTTTHNADMFKADSEFRKLKTQTTETIREQKCTIESYAKTIKEYTSAIDNLTTETQRLKQLYDSTCRDKDFEIVLWKNKSVKYETDLKTFQTNHHEYKAQLENTYNETIKNLKKQIRALDDEIKTLNHIKEKQVQVAKTNELLETQVRNTMIMINDKENDIKSLERKVVSLQNNVSDKEQRIQTIINDSKRIQKTKTELSSMLETTSKERNQLNDALTRVQKSLDELTIRYQVIEQQYNDSKKDKISIQQQNGELKSVNNQMASTIQSLQNKVTELQAKYAEQISSATSQRRQHEDQLKRVALTIDEKNREINEFADKEQTYRNKLKELHQQIETIQLHNQSEKQKLGKYIVQMHKNSIEYKKKHATYTTDR